MNKQAPKNPILWADTTFRVEHLIAPRGYLGPGRHLPRCPCQCASARLCPLCGNPSKPVEFVGRWYVEGGHTDIPFDPVWVRLSCGCEAGDKSLGMPTRQCPHETVEFVRDRGPDPRDQKTRHGWHCTECGDAVGGCDD